MPHAAEHLIDLARYPIHEDGPARDALLACVRAQLADDGDRDAADDSADIADQGPGALWKVETPRAEGGPPPLRGRERPPRSRR